MKIDLMKETQPFYELAHFGEDQELLETAQACVNFHKTHENDVLKSKFNLDPDALEKVSEDALNKLITCGRNIHGVTTEREISNCIPFNINVLPDSVLNDELGAVRVRLDRIVRDRLKALFQGPFEVHVLNSGHFFYPTNAFMSWHTNSKLPGWRFYINYAEEPGKSFFRYRDPQTGEIVTSTDRKWNFRLFWIDDEELFWHAVYSETPRYSFGYRMVLEPRVSLANRAFRKLKRLILERKQIQCAE